MTDHLSRLLLARDKLLECRLLCRDPTTIPLGTHPDALCGRARPLALQIEKLRVEGEENVRFQAGRRLLRQAAHFALN